MNKSLVIHKLYVIGPNGAKNIVSRIIPLHNQIKWVDFDDEKNSLQITYTNNEVDIYTCIDQNNKRLREAVDQLIMDYKNNINL